MYIRWRILAVILFALAIVVVGADIPGMPENVVHSAGQASAEGYNSRDRTQFERHFAMPDEGNDAAGLAHSKDLDDSTFEFRSLDVSVQKIDLAHRVATVHYRAEIAINRNEKLMYAATVEQNVALVQVNGRWRCASGAAPNVKTTSGAAKPTD